PAATIGVELVAGLHWGCEGRVSAPCGAPPVTAGATRGQHAQARDRGRRRICCALSAQAALACDEKVERAEQPQHKPAVAEKAQKQNKQQQKAKKADTSEKTTVARADK